MDRTPYSREAVNLLDQIAERALDDDYYVARPGKYSRSRSVNTLATAAVLALFALLVTVSAVQSYQDRPGTEAAQTQLRADVEEQQALQDKLTAEVTSLEQEIAGLPDELGDSPEITAMRISVGSTAVSGDGLVVTIDPVAADGVSDLELRALINQLWSAGAEAIAINGQRWAALSSLRATGGPMIVNFGTIGAPFRLQVIGDADDLRANLETSGENGYWERRDAHGELTYSVSDVDDQVLPAAAEHRTKVVVSQAIESEGDTS